MSLALEDKKGKIGIHHALAGIKAVFKSERNFRFHIIAMVLVLTSSLFLKLTQLEWAIIIIVIGLVLLTELLNTAIEKMIDYLRPAIHPDARFIKDAAAGAVLVSSIVAVLVGGIIFLPKLLSIF